MLVSLWFVWIIDPYLLGAGEVSRVMSACHCCAWWKVMQSHVSLSLLFMMEGDDGLALFQVALLSLWPHSILSCFGFCWNWRSVGLPSCCCTGISANLIDVLQFKVPEDGRLCLLCPSNCFSIVSLVWSCLWLLGNCALLCMLLLKNHQLNTHVWTVYIVCDLDLRNISWKLVKVSATEYWLHFYAVVVVVPWFGEECCGLPMLSLCHATFWYICKHKRWNFSSHHHSSCTVSCEFTSVCQFVQELSYKRGTMQHETAVT